MRPPRVAFVVGNLNAGGAERAALNLAHASGVDCRVVAEWSGGELAGDPLATAATMLSTRAAPAHRASRVRVLRRHLRDTRPDLVISMLSPLVATLAGSGAGVAVGHWVQAPWSQTTRAGERSARGTLDRAVLAWVGRQSALVMGVTPGIVRECAGFGMPAAKLSVLPNGLDVGAAPTAGRRRSADEPLALVSVGRLEAPKRQDVLLRAVASLAQSREVRLEILGTGVDQARHEQLCEQLGLSDIVTFHGFVRDPMNVVADADIFVHATDYEGFGNVIVEALACGVPVVSSDVPYGPRWILNEDPRLGILVEPDSVAAMVAGISAVADRRPFAAEVRAAARARAEEFSIERVARDFDELVSRLHL